MRALIATLLLAGVGAGVAAAQGFPPTSSTMPLPPVAGVQLATLDPESRFEFSMSTRWGQKLLGRFPQSEGEVVATADGRRQVRITLGAARVEIVGHPRYTRFTRGPRFFDVERYPEVQFLSDPYTAQLLREGGVLTGLLRMHGVQRRERFVVAPSTCERAGRDCDIVAQGTVLRGNYDLAGWRMALRDEVRFTMHVRLRDTAATSGAQ